MGQLRSSSLPGGSPPSVLRIIHRAGVEPWPRLFHNMRATRQTELTEKFPVHVVCSWMGNSATIAAKHYLQVTDEHFERAAKSGAQDAQKADSALQNRVQQPAVQLGTETQKAQETWASLDADPVESGELALAGLPPRGIEPLLSD
jgi:hypothetical protein